MTDDAKRWVESLGIKLDENGKPERAFAPGPPRPCIRCGGLAEGATDSAVFVGGRFYNGPICGDCHSLPLKEFAAGFPAGDDESPK